jgi:transposase
MRIQGSPEELEHRRQLAVRRSLEGYSADEIAEFLDVAPRTVWRWLASFREEGFEGLSARPVSGRPPKLTTTQEKVVRRWLTENPTTHGFATELWTGPRLAQLIRQEFGVRLNPRYLCTWMRARGFTPQKPQRVAREGDPEEVAARLAVQWPRIKKRPDARGRTSP